MNQDLSVPTILRRAYDQLPDHIKQRSDRIAELHVNIAAVSKSLEDDIAAATVRKSEINHLRDQCVSLNEEMKRESQKWVRENL